MRRIGQRVGEHHRNLGIDVRHPGGLTYVEIAAAAAHTVARLSDGSVVAWGSNYWGECSVPALPVGLTFVEIAAGLYYTVARRSDGSVVAWGANGSGQCTVPAPPGGLTYVGIAAGGNHTVARRSDGLVVAWGYNGYGQCTVPALLGGLTYVGIAAGSVHTVARRSDGSVVAWGANGSGQCTVPALPGGLTYVEIAAGAGHTVARTAGPAAIAYPGTNEDLALLTATNAGPLSGGIGNDIKNVLAGNTVTIEVVSPLGTFNSMEFLLIGQCFTTGAPPAPALPNIWLSYPGLAFFIGNYPPGTSGPVLPPGGAFVSLGVPPGLSGSSGIFQGVVIAPGSAANGFYAATDAHEFRIL